MPAKERPWLRSAVPAITAPVEAMLPIETPGQYAFLLVDAIDRDTLDVAFSEGRRLGVPAVRVLIARAWISPAAYIDALGRHLGLADTGSAAPGPSRPIDAIHASPDVVRGRVAAARAEGARPLLVDPKALDFGLPASLRRRRTYLAAHHLQRRRPELSAGRRTAAWQIVAAVSVPGLIAGGLLVLPEATLIATTAAAAVPFLFVVGLRLIALAVALAAWPFAPGSGRVATDDAALPTYAVLVALYNEAEVLPGLVDAIAEIDYPPEKLDAVLILEESDRATREAARGLDLPPFMRIVLVPERQPRTKPKALNYALTGVTSEFVAVFDAEDQPEPGQLRKAVAAFRRFGPGLACVQARLTIRNARASLITRQFTLEYAALFGGLLPALAWLRLPVPLGGTSNHFPVALLQEIGAWDPHNVTEDADLGVRIARSGGRVGVIASATEEEAPETFGIWLRQRTRWQKGFMQTWAVHMRRPLRLLREVGPAGFIGVNAVIGGHVLSSLLHPFCVAALIWAILDGRLFGPGETELEDLLINVALFNFAAGYATALLLAAVAILRSGKAALLPHLLLTPLYWQLVSLAAWRALFQLVYDPYRWEKTPHAPRPGSATRVKVPDL